jgi:hypothetical protein
MEYQFGDAESWHHEPYFENMRNNGGGRYDFTFGPYFLNADFRIRFTVRVTDGDGAVSQLAERIIVVRNCPPPPVPNEPPTVAWIESGNLAEPEPNGSCEYLGLVTCMNQWVNSTVAGFSCNPRLPNTRTLVVRVSDDTTAVEQLKVNLAFIYGDVYRDEAGVVQIRWLENTFGVLPMTYGGDGRYNFVVGPYAATTTYAVAYFVGVEDADGAVVTTESQLTGMYIDGCVELR